MRFLHETLPQRIRFASAEAAASLASEIQVLGSERVMVIASESGGRLAQRITADIPVALQHHEAVTHVPVAVAERARAAATTCRADVLVSIGGGSATGLAKAVALTTGLPIVAVPTTYAGSEVTDVWGMTEGTTKTTGRDPRVLPKAVVYDASLTQSLPIATSIASGLNAVAHCVDSLWAPRADPVNAALATEGIRALRVGLPQLISSPTAIEGRERTLFGAYLAAAAFASAGSGLHHKICHVLGGMFDLPHAQTHAAVLPHVLAFNAAHAPEAERRLAAAFDAPDAISGLRALHERLHAPTALRDYGMPESGIVPAARAVVAAALTLANPAPVSTDAISHLLRRAREGAEL
ncbi:maleylacetate reductase [Streptomyces sp. NPDC052043]|uniref:maleylacetate reductase n=1 Tax=Streptomyces sp. NPDC052043 TaxID=3365684 RepID=UPI0037D5BDC4